MIYNTQRKRLPLPEYGRGVQEMVDHAVTIRDREDRNRCAAAIVAIMGNMYPHLRDVPEFKHTLWDHLAAMSGYELDIDYPYEVTSRRETKLTPLPYPMKRIRLRHYGYLLEKFADKLAQMPEGKEREALTFLVAAQMKRDLFNWNRDIMDDQKVAQDLADYTHGTVTLDVEHFKCFLGGLNKNWMQIGTKQGATKRNRRKN